MSTEKNDSSLLAFILGAVAGAAAGLLLAPHTGREARRRLQRWADDLEEKGRDILEEGKDLFAEGREKAAHSKDTAETVIRKVFDDDRRS